MSALLYMAAGHCSSKRETVLFSSNIVVQVSVPLQGSDAGSGDDGSTAVITREHDFDLSFQCSYSKKKILSLQFVPEGRVEIPGVGTKKFIF